MVCWDSLCCRVKPSTGPRLQNQVKVLSESQATRVFPWTEWLLTVFRAPSVSLQTLGWFVFPHVRHPTSAWSSPAMEFSLLVLQLFFSLPSVAGEEAVPHPSVTKHYFLGRIHHSWQWKVGVQTQRLSVIITAIFFVWQFSLLSAIAFNVHVVT